MTSPTSTATSPQPNPRILFGDTPRRTSTPIITIVSPSGQQTQPPAVDFDDIVPPKQMKSMAELDREDEARLARRHRERVKKMGHGFRTWVGKLAKEKRDKMA